MGDLMGWTMVGVEGGGMRDRRGRGLFAALELLFFWKGDDFPGGRIESDNPFWAITFEHHLQSELDIDSGAAVCGRHFFYLEHGGAFAVVDWVIGHEGFESYGEAADGFCGGRTPVAWRWKVGIFDGDVIEERGIDPGEERDVDDLFCVIDGGDPACEAAFANEGAMGLELVFCRAGAAFVIEPEVGDAAWSVEGCPRQVEQDFLAGLEGGCIREAVSGEDAGMGLDVECFWCCGFWWFAGGGGFWDGGFRERHREFHRFGIVAFDCPELVLAGVKGEVVFESDAALEVFLDGLTFVESAWVRGGSVVRILEVEKSVEVCAEWDVLEGGWGASEPDASVRQHLGVERTIEDTTLLVISAVDADAEVAFEMIYGDEFTGDAVFRTVGRIFSADELEPFRFVLLCL